METKRWVLQTKQVLQWENKPDFIWFAARKVRFMMYFFERGVAALAWPMLAEAAAKGFGREELTDIYRSAVPDVKLRTAQSGAAQMWRFVNELSDGDAVLTYSPTLRRYRVGRITGGAVHCPQWDDEKMSLVRPVEWLGEVCRE